MNIHEEEISARLIDLLSHTSRIDTIPYGQRYI